MNRVGSKPSMRLLELSSSTLPSGKASLSQVAVRCLMVSTKVMTILSSLYPNHLITLLK